MPNFNPYAALAIPQSNWFYNSNGSDIANTTAVTLTAAVTGKKNYIVALQVSNTDTSVATIVQVLDGDSTILWEGFLTPYIAAAPGGHMINIEFPTPIPGTAATAMKFKCVTTSAQVRVNAQGFVGY